MSLKQELEEIGRHHWRSFFRAKNPYQSWGDFVRGGFTCPKCGQYQEHALFGFEDCACVSTRGSILTEKRLMCINLDCDFEEIIWRHPNHDKIMNMTNEEFQKWKRGEKI